jgi:hypothetical protein
MGIEAAIIGGAIIGGVATSQAADAQANASSDASAAQLQANRENIALQREIFNQQREDNAPWRNAGAQAIKQLQASINNGTFDPANFKFTADPGYQFRLQEGVNALDASASARGRLRSGAQDRAVTRYGQNMASDEFSRAWNRNLATKTTNFNQLASLANVGQIANSANQAAGSQFAANAGQSTINTGNAIAQNAINQGNVTASAYQGYATTANQGIQNYLLYKDHQAAR